MLRNIIMYVCNNLIVEYKLNYEYNSFNILKVKTDLSVIKCISTKIIMISR